MHTFLIIPIFKKVFHSSHTCYPTMTHMYIIGNRKISNLYYYCLHFLKKHPSEVHGKIPQKTRKRNYKNTKLQESELIYSSLTQKKTIQSQIKECDL